MDEEEENFVVLAYPDDNHRTKQKLLSLRELIVAVLLFQALALIIIVGSVCGYGYCKSEPMFWASPEDELLAFRQHQVGPEIQAYLESVLGSDYFNDDDLENDPRRDRFIMETRNQAMDWMILGGSASVGGYPRSSPPTIRLGGTLPSDDAKSCVEGMQRTNRGQSQSLLLPTFDRGS